MSRKFARVYIYIYIYTGMAMVLTDPDCSTELHACTATCWLLQEHPDIATALVRVGALRLVMQTSEKLKTQPHPHKICIF